MKQLFAGLVLAVLALCPVAGIAQEPGLYIVDADAPDGYVNFRAGPGQNHAVKTTLPAGTDGLVIESCMPADDGISRRTFCFGTWEGIRGYTSSCCITRIADVPIRWVPTDEPLVRPPAPVEPATYDLSVAFNVWIAPYAYLSQDCKAGYVNCSPPEVGGPIDSEPGRVERTGDGRMTVSMFGIFSAVCGRSDWLHTVLPDDQPGLLRCRYEETPQGINVYVSAEGVNLVGDRDETILILSHNPLRCGMNNRQQDDDRYRRLKYAARCIPS